MLYTTEIVPSQLPKKDSTYHSQIGSPNAHISDGFLLYGFPHNISREIWAGDLHWSCNQSFSFSKYLLKQKLMILILFNNISQF